MAQEQYLKLLCVLYELSEWSKLVVVSWLPQIICALRNFSSPKSITVNWVPVDEQILNRAVISRQNGN
jgi:hypothetical protein